MESATENGAAYASGVHAETLPPVEPRIVNGVLTSDHPSVGALLRGAFEFSDHLVEALEQFAEHVGLVLRDPRREVAFADENRADARHLLEDLWQVFDGSADDYLAATIR